MHRWVVLKAKRHGSSRTCLRLPPKVEMRPAALVTNGRGCGLRHSEPDFYTLRDGEPGRHSTARHPGSTTYKHHRSSLQEFTGFPSPERAYRDARKPLIL